MKTRIVTALWFVLWLFGSQSLALDNPPLEPPDRSSPRATLQTFLTSADVVGEFIRQEYHAEPTYAGFVRMFALGETPLQCLDLSEIAPAGRNKSGVAAALALYEILSRVELPPMEQVPGEAELASLRGEPIRWTIPHTELTLVRNATGEFVFSAETVARSGDFYSRVRHLPYLRQMPMAGLHDIAVLGGGWMIPYRWIEAMPDVMRAQCLASLHGSG